ncbi:hypothetical protein FJ251_08225 [bacterium]|nr:hypothetical protein [bacterium]
MKSLLAAFACLLAALPALAQETPVVFTSGLYAFNYQQWPFGSYHGSFSAEGASLDSLIWGGGQLEAAGGSLQVVQDSTIAWAYGAVYQEDQTVDLGLLILRRPGLLTPGDYPIDVTGFTSQFVFFDGLSGLTIPEDPTDIQAWLNGLAAEHRFFGATGSITVSEVSDSSFVGSFSGRMLDPTALMIISISSGVFDMVGLPVLPTAAPAAPAALAHGSWPNPFNPQTRLYFTLPAAGAARLSVHDAAGRRLATLWDGPAPAGRSEVDWTARDAAGRPLPAGLYFYRLRTAAGVAGGKLMLVQ